MNFEKARYNMVEQQIRTWDVLDSQVLLQMESIAREDFVPSAYRKLAYSDKAIPLNAQTSMMLPREVGRLLQALEIKQSDLVLQVGTGTGYVTALLAKMAAHVVSVESDPSLHEQASKNLQHLHCNNVTLALGNAAKDWEQGGPYNVICLTGAVYTLPESFKRRLHMGGRLFVVTGEEPAMQAQLITRVDEDQWQTINLFETVLPYLEEAGRPVTFEF